MPNAPKRFYYDDDEPSASPNTGGSGAHAPKSGADGAGKEGGAKSGGGALIGANANQRCVGW